MTTLTDLATAIGIRNLLITITVFTAVCLYAAKRGYGRIGPTLAVLALGTPAALLAGILTGSLTHRSGDPRWAYAGILALALVTAGTLIGAGIRAALNDTAHLCQPGASGRCACGLNQPTTDRVEVAA